MPTLIGTEAPFTFQNLNISRGLLFDQDNFINHAKASPSGYETLSTGQTLRTWMHLEANSVRLIQINAPLRQVASNASL